MTRTNKEIAEAFAAQFDPPLRVTRTERVDNIPQPEAYNVAYWDNARQLGITAVVHHGQIHAFIEAAGDGAIAESAGLVMAKALGLFKRENSKE